MNNIGENRYKKVESTPIVHINREIMSFNLSLIFVYGMCLFSIHVNGFPLPDIIQQDQPIDTADLPSTNQISEILNQATTSNNFNTSEGKNEEKSLCESLLTTLTTSQGTDAIILAVARVQHLIRNHNQDTQRTIISNIFTTLDSCLKDQIPDHDFHSFRENLRNMIENYDSNFPKQSGIIREVPLDSNPDGNKYVSASEEIHLRSEHENVPRDVEDEVFTDVPTLTGFSPVSQRRNSRTRRSGHEGRSYVSSTGTINTLDHMAPVMNSGRPGGVINGLGKKLFLFDTGVPKPAIDEGLSRKIFLFDKGMHGDPNKSYSEVAQKDGKKSHFLFDDNLPQLSLGKNSGKMRFDSLDMDY